MFGDVPDEQQLQVIVFERHVNFCKRELEVSKRKLRLSLDFPLTISPLIQESHVTNRGVQLTYLDPKTSRYQQGGPIDIL